MKTNNNYSELIDHLVSTMPTSSPKSSQRSYEEYVAQVNNERAKIDVHNLTETIMQIGYKIDTALAKIIDTLDNITNDKFDPENVTCTIDDKQVDMKECTEDFHT